MKWSSTLLVVLACATAVVTVCAVVVLAGFRCTHEHTRVLACKASIAALETQVTLFRRDEGRYPTKEEGLAMLLSEHAGGGRGPYLSGGAIPLDPWGNPFQYQLLNGVPDITSLGADGTPATDDDITKNTEPD